MTELALQIYNPTMLFKSAPETILVDLRRPKLDIIYSYIHRVQMR